MIEAHVKHSHLLEHPDLGRQTSGEIVIHENDLVQGLAHLSDTARNAPTKVVVRKDKNRNRRVPKILRNAKLEPVVVQEDRIKRLVEELGGDRTLKLVEAQIQVLEGRQRQHNHRKLAHEPIIAQVQLVQKLHFAETSRHHPTKPVRVDVEERQIGKKAELGREVAGNVSMVEVNSSHHPHFLVFRRRSTKDPLVRAHVRPIPAGREVERVGVNGLFP